MKKIVAFILLTAFFLNIIGYHFIFQIQQQKLKKQMESYLHKKADKKDAVQFRFSLSDKTALSKLKWEDDNEKEFMLDGEMYDVIEKRKESGELILLCIKDKKESHLVKEYTKMNKQNQGDPSSKHKTNILLKLITGVFIQTDISLLYLPDFPTEKNQVNLTENISPAIKEILIPPQV